MNFNSNSQMKKTGQPHFLGEKGGESRHSRSKIQITHIQSRHNSGERSRYAPNLPPTPTEHSTHMEQSRQRQHIFQSQSSNSQPEFNNRLYGLMKEQIDIAAYNFKEKMGQTLKIQAKEIQRLTKILGYNHKVILKQQDVIDRMGRNQDYMTSTSRSRVTNRDQPKGASKSPRKISLTQNRSAKKITNQRQASPLKGQLGQVQTLNLKITALRSRIDELDEKLWMYSNRYKDIVFKINQFEKILSGQLWNRIKRCQNIVESYLGKKDHELLLQSSMKGGSSRQVDEKMRNIGEEMRELKQLMFNLVNREFTYDSFQLDKLKESFRSISRKVDKIGDSHINHESSPFKKKHLTGGNAFNMAHSYSLQPESEHFLDQFEHPRDNLHSHSQTSIINHQSMGNNQIWSNDSQNQGDSDQDEFYFQQSKHEKVERDQILKHFQNIMRKKKQHFPVKVEIDGTGYLKDCETGMYILDQFDNGFQLTKKELDFLREKGIIAI